MLCHFFRCQGTICQNAPAFEGLKHLITSMCINSYIGFKFDRCNHDNRILLQYWSISEFIWHVQYTHKNILRLVFKYFRAAPYNVQYTYIIQCTICLTSRQWRLVNRLIYSIEENNIVFDPAALFSFFL